jgi:hypothetical protein
MGEFLFLCSLSLLGDGRGFVNLCCADLRNK